MKKQVKRNIRKGIQQMLHLFFIPRLFFFFFLRFLFSFGIYWRFYLSEFRERALHKQVRSTITAV